MAAWLFAGCQGTTTTWDPVELGRVSAPGGTLIVERRTEITQATGDVRRCSVEVVLRDPDDPFADAARALVPELEVPCRDRDARAAELRLEACGTHRDASILRIIGPFAASTPYLAIEHPDETTTRVFALAGQRCDEALASAVRGLR